MSTDRTHATVWETYASQLQRTVNAAWWVQAFMPWFVGLGLVAFAAVFYLRSTWVQLNAPLVGGVAAGALLVIGLAAWFVVRRKFISRDECLVRLESQMRLHNALSAAKAGVIPWPEPPAEEMVKTGLRWDWRWLVTPMLAVGACLALAFLIPVPPPEANGFAGTPPPSAAQQAEETLKELEKEEVAREEDLEKFQKELDALKNKPVDEWYNHSNLEAADALKDSLQQAAGQLGRQFDAAERSLGTLASEEAGTPQGEKARENASKELAAALEGMKNGALQPNKELMKKLEALDPNELAKNLSKEELDKLREQLKKNGGQCKNCSGQGDGQGQGKGGAGSLEQQLRDELEKGEGEGDEGEDGQEGQEGDGQEGKGKGGVQRGPGTTALNLSKKESELDADKIEKEQTRDMSRLMPGDLLGTSDGAHTVDKTAVGPLAGGGTNAIGEGGDATWKENLLPEEKSILQKYFK
jgi:hypothetical protein